MLPRPPATRGPSALRLPLPCALGLAAVALAAGIVQATGGGAGGAVYTVAQVQPHLHHDPAAWVGRTLRVRGIAIPAGCSTWDAQQDLPCPDRWRQGIVDPDGVTLLPLTVGPPNPLLASVRRLPLLGGLAPAPRAVHWGAVATYRVRLGALPRSLCGTTPCYEARLLDAAPEASGEG
jgi:hypothetical protein